MKRLGLFLAGLLIIGTTGCQVTRDWVIDTAKKIAVDVVDTQIEKFNEKTIVPAFAKVEEQLGEKIDANDDGVWDQEELQSAIAQQVGPAISAAQRVFLEESDKNLGEKIKDLATKEDGMKGLLLLLAAWLLSKLGIKMGPKGLQKLGEMLVQKKDSEGGDSSPKVDL